MKLRTKLRRNKNRLHITKRKSLSIWAIEKEPSKSKSDLILIVVYEDFKSIDENRVKSI